MASSSGIMIGARRHGSAIQAVVARARQFHSSQSAVAATEFALLIPIMLTMYLGTAEVTQGVIAKRRVNMLARTLSDLTSQEGKGISFNSTDMQAIFDASTAVIAPLSVAPLKMRISSILIKANGTTCVDWSDSRNMTKLVPGSSVILPTGLADPAATTTQGVVMAEVQYLYTPVMAYVITGPILISDVPSYMRPRNNTSVKVDISVQNPASGCP